MIDLAVWPVAKNASFRSQKRALFGWTTSVFCWWSGWFYVAQRSSL